MKTGIAAAVFTAAMAGCAAASAATVTQTFTFTAKDLLAFSGPIPAPTDPVTGTIRVTYDPDVEQGPTSVGLDVLGLNIPDPGGSFVYTLAGDGVLDIGTKPNAGGGFTISTAGDYGLSIFNVRTTPRLGYFQHRTDNDGNYYTFDGTLTVSGAPEPRTWALVIGGFGLAGGALRGRRASIAPGRA